MDFRILGPIEVVADGHPLPLGGARPRAVLALLLTRPNEVLSVDRLVDDLWGSSPPRTAANTVQQCISLLRKQLGAHRIETRPPGYVLHVEPDELDLARFESLVSSGEVESLRAALELWRGPPLADLSYEPFVQGEIARLEEMRLAAQEKLIDRELELGYHSELVGEIERLVSRHPLRERFRGQLMLALYRSGRQAEALDAYRDARAVLVENIGIEPSAALQELERAILRHDSSLDVDLAAQMPGRRRSILVLPSAAVAVDVLLRLAEPLARNPPRDIILASLLPDEADDLSSATATLVERRRKLAERGVQARVAAYRSDARGDDAVTLATEQDADLLIVDVPSSRLTAAWPDPELRVVLETAPCDVGMLVRGELFESRSEKAVLVPFGGTDHDWSAIEVAAWLARSLGVPLRLAGTERSADGRDASRLLARASLALQAAVGIHAEPVLVPPGLDGLLEIAPDASILVVGLSGRWRAEGMGEVRSELASRAESSTLLVRRGLRPGGLAPAETMTRFTWTLADGSS